MFNKICFSELKIGTSFESHPQLAIMLKEMGIHIGKQCFSPEAAKAIARSISQTMNDRLIQKLKEEDAPLSLILDGSTSHKQKHYLG